MLLRLLSILWFLLLVLLENGVGVMPLVSPREIKEITLLLKMLEVELANKMEVV